MATIIRGQVIMRDREVTTPSADKRSVFWKRFNRRYTPVSRVIGLSAAVLMLIGCSGQNGGLAPADAASCSVYQAFYEQLDRKSGVLFRSATLRLPPIAGGEFDYTAEWASDWQHLAGRRESILLGLKEEAGLDASMYFSALEAAPKSIVGCLPLGGLSIHDGRLNEALQREALFSLGLRSGAELVTLSPVAFSPDGQHAIIYVTLECGGLCGGGVFYVYEKQERWTRIDAIEVWVS